MSLTVKRREFLHCAAGGVAGLAASGLTVKGLSSMNALLAAEEVHIPQGPETWALSVCSQCPAGCGLRVRKIGPRAVRIAGNPLHPINNGGLCPKGLAGLQELYHPDRVRGPMKNVGDREAPRWKEILWEEGIQTVVTRLGELKKRGEAHSLVFVSGNAGPVRTGIFRQFLQDFGSPNFFSMPCGTEANDLAAFLQQGVPEGLSYDLESTRYLVSFGVNLLEGWGAPVRTMQAFGKWRDSAGSRQTKFVQIEPRFSLTASRADEWVAIRPGTEAALALGIAYVLISEGLYDARFVNEHTFGFDDWIDGRGRRHLGFRSLVLREYRLNRVSNLTDVPAETILRLGREFGRNRPAVALGALQTSTLGCGFYAAMAVHSLNALVGSLEMPGGVLVRPPLPGTENHESGNAGKGSRSRPLGSDVNSLWGRPDVTRLPDAILSGKPGVVGAILLYQADPVFSLPNGAQFEKALRNVPFVVSFSPFLDDTAALADLILPDCTGLERWQEATSPSTYPLSLLSVSPPAVEPRHQTRDSADVVLAIAKELGVPGKTADSPQTIDEALRAQVEQVFKAQAGYVFATRLEERWNRLLERSGWWAPTYSTADELWTLLQENGGWWEPTYFLGEWNRVLQTRSGRFEFYSQRLADWASGHPQTVRAAGFEEGDDRVCLPHQVPVPNAPPDYPLLLIPVEVLPIAGGTGSHLPYLQQISGMNVFENWESWLEMNPVTAQESGLSDRDWVWIESPSGRARVKLRLYAGVRPGVVHLPLGYGRKAGSSWAQRGVNPMHLVADPRDPISGMLQFPSGYVRVSRG